MASFYPGDKCATFSPNFAGVFLGSVNLELNGYHREAARTRKDNEQWNMIMKVQFEYMLF